MVMHVATFIMVYLAVKAVVAVTLLHSICRVLWSTPFSRNISSILFFVASTSLKV